jgi:hypothetical protein
LAAVAARVRFRACQFEIRAARTRALHAANALLKSIRYTITFPTYNATPAPARAKRDTYDSFATGSISEGDRYAAQRDVHRAISSNNNRSNNRKQRGWNENILAFSVCTPGTRSVVPLRDGVAIRLLLRPFLTTQMPHMSHARSNHKKALMQCSMKEFTPPRARQVDVKQRSISKTRTKLDRQERRGTSATPQQHVDRFIHQQTAAS